MTRRHPFCVIRPSAPVRDLLERHPGHRTAHAAFLSTIRDVRAGQSGQPQADPAPLLDELISAEVRVMRYLPSNLRAPEIASALFVSTNTIRTRCATSTVTNSNAANVR